MLRFHNTYTRRKEAFRPLVDGEVRMYTCGPTVYDHAHIGNFRAYLWEDLLRRFLKARGFRITQVMNITDVDDKTIRGAREAGVNLEQYTDRYIRAFFEDLDTLGVERAEHYPRATRHIPEMVSIVQTLLEKGHAYESKGSIYFRLDSFPEYGRLARLHRDGLIANFRVDSDEYEKSDVRDFVLWKGRRENEPSWDTPLGAGRPGWHLECSAMSMKYLGPTFDIHTGGTDNIFPHHENEIAQSESATGKKFVRYWMHCAHLVVNGEKMSKSKGNFFTLRDLLERGYDPQAIRYLLVSQHYRKPLNFTLDGIAWAASNLERLGDCVRRLVDGPAAAGRDDTLAARLAHARQKFYDALDDDLNSAAALGHLFDLVREVNTASDRGPLPADTTEALRSFFGEVSAILGVRVGTSPGLDAEVEGMISRREEHRRARRFREADAIRDELLRRGILLEDTPAGVRWKRRS